MSPVSPELQHEIEQFLTHESSLLDTNRQSEWLDLLHDAFLYRIPVPVAREEPTQERYDRVLEFANESKSFLEMRFRRIGSDFAWSERPAAYVRHFVTNVEVTELEPDSVWEVRSNVLLVRSRQPEPPVHSSAGRVDRIERHEGGFLMRERLVHLDTEIPTDSQLAVIY